MNKHATRLVHRLANSEAWRWAWHTNHDDRIPATTGTLLQCALVIALIAAQAPAALALALAPVIVLSLTATEGPSDQGRE